MFDCNIFPHELIAQQQRDADAHKLNHTVP